MEKILVTGALGQIGSELVVELSRKYGTENVVGSDVREPENSYHNPFAKLDVTDHQAFAAAVSRHRIDTVYHMAAVLSATGEKNPGLAWRVNTQGLYNVLEIFREHRLSRLFYPSSIAVFGPDAAKQNTPQQVTLHPQTMYGVTKATGEMLCRYYHQKFAVDVRGIRYPGLISSKTLPGGGTTDYAVEIYYAAVKQKRYECFVGADTILPMMYMPDAIRGTIQLMEADGERLQHRVNYNMTAMSFSAGELAKEIAKHIPDFECSFCPDFRQQLADSWPQTIDDRWAREEWGWEAHYDLATVTGDMLEKLQQRHLQGKL